MGSQPNSSQATMAGNNGSTMWKNTESIEMFWKLFNQCLQIMSEDPSYKFNPCKFMFDEGGANFIGLENVFGEEVLRHVTTCQWHFLQCVWRAASKKLAVGYCKEFENTMRKLCKSSSVEEYNYILESPQDIWKAIPDLDRWIMWWDAWKYHIIDVFWGFNLPPLNLAKIGLASLKKGLSHNS